MTELARRDDTAVAIPERIGGVIVPRDVPTLEKFLEQNKQNQAPLPWRASALAAVDAHYGTNLVSALYLMGGVDRDVSPDHVLILGDKPYVEAVGACQVVIGRGGSAWADIVGLFPCADPRSLCPESLKYAEAKASGLELRVEGMSYVYRGTATMPGRGRAIVTRQACAHTWAGGRKDTTKRFLPYMAETRAKGRAAKDLLGWRDNVIAPEEDLDADMPGLPHDGAALGSGGAAPHGPSLVAPSDRAAAGLGDDPARAEVHRPAPSRTRSGDGATGAAPSEPAADSDPGPVGVKRGRQMRRDTPHPADTDDAPPDDDDVPLDVAELVRAREELAALALQHGVSDELLAGSAGTHYGSRDWKNLTLEQTCDLIGRIRKHFETEATAGAQPSATQDSLV